MPQTRLIPRKYDVLDDVVNNGMLLDLIIEKMRLKNDAALGRALEVPPTVISKVRHGHQPIGAMLLIRMNELTDLSIGEMKGIALRTR